METHDLEWYNTSEVDVNGVDVPNDCVLQHGMPVLENRDPVWSEEFDIYIYIHTYIYIYMYIYIYNI